MDTSFNDTNFGARHEHYRDMLRSAEANIALRRGELRPEPRLAALARTWAGSLSNRLHDLSGLLHPAASRRPLAALGPAESPCPDGTPCK